MQEFILYNIKVAALITVFYMFYRLLLARQSFHRLNRIVLLTTALLSFVLPLCVITFHQTVLVGDASVTLGGNTMAGQAIPASEALPLWERPWLLTAVVAVYLLGVALRLGLTAMRLFRLHRFIAHAEHYILDDGINLAVTTAPVAPCSWMNTIVLSRADYAAGHQELLTHERAHIRLHHSFDVVAMELLVALQWFNPVIWMIRADLRSLHEYEADQTVLQSGVDVHRYVDLLIEKAQASGGYSLANSINDSILKSRIVMMINEKKHHNWLRALYVVPVVAVSLTLSAKTETEVRPLNNHPITVTERNVATTPAQPTAAVTEVLSQAKAAQDDKEKQIFIVDGKVMDDMASIKADDVANVTVIKGDKIATVLGSRYADRKPEAVIIVTLKKDATADKSTDVVEVIPELPDVTSAMTAFLAQNMRYPVTAYELGIMGRVVCQFTVEADGSLSDVHVVRDGTKSPGVKEFNEIVVTAYGKPKETVTEAESAAGKQALADEAVRVIKAMPKFTPSKQDGKAVRVKYNVPFTFNLQ